MFLFCSFDLLVIAPQRRASIALSHWDEDGIERNKNKTDLGGVSEYLGEGCRAAGTAEERRIAWQGARAGSR
jgi:hypothetical protein